MLNVVLNYSTSVLNTDYASRVAETFQHVLFTMVQNPLKTYRELDICSPRDKTQLAIWNKTPPKFSPLCIHAVIQEQCRKRGTSIAVSAWDGDMTYAELDEHSSRVAAHLQQLGVGPEVYVPLCFEKSKLAIVALLGVIKAGGAYVFLDPSYPVSRMRSICDDLHANFLVTSARTNSVGKNLGMKVVCLKDDCAIDGDTSSSRPYIESQSQPYNALYGVFTSGSSGKPKGVTMEHGAFYAAAMANGPALHLDEQSRVLQFANFIYDVGNRDVLMTLMFGGCICIPSDQERLTDLENFMNRYRVNWASLTPTSVSLLDATKVQTLRHLLMGGEALTADVTTTWARRVELMNAYGPCECAAISSLRNVTSSDSDPANIGHGVG
ncbi:acetyl-CoA synthetase-like protein, partial [Dothidotthia symphoricarpi CBS 119687]